MIVTSLLFVQDSATPKPVTPEPPKEAPRNPEEKRNTSRSESPVPGPPAPVRSMNDSEDGDNVDADEPEYDPDTLETAAEFPISHEVPMKDHTRVVSALAMDPSGARFVSGSYDYDCKLWDFGGMSANPKPFKTWEPAGTYYVSSHK